MFIRSKLKGQVTDVLPPLQFNLHVELCYLDRDFEGSGLSFANLVD